MKKYITCDGQFKEIVSDEADNQQKLLIENLIN